MSDPNQILPQNHFNFSPAHTSLSTQWPSKIHHPDSKSALDSTQHKSTDKKRSHRSYDDNETRDALHYNRTPSKKQKTSDATDSLPLWTCVLCTFNNRLKDERCSICFALKPGTKPPNSHNTKEQKDTDDNSNNISKLINGLQNVRLNANHDANDIQQDNDTFHSMDGIIDKLQTLQFDEKAHAAMNESSKMNDIIDKLSNLDVAQSNQNDINHMIKDINAEVNKFVVELQNQLYWKFKIKKVTSKFKKMQHREAMDRIIQMLTFYHDHHSEEGILYQFVNDTESDYKHLKADYQHIISENIIANQHHSITMKKAFDLYIDYVSQTVPRCDNEACLILKKFREEEDDDIFDDKLRELKTKMDRLHCYLFHTEACGIVIDTKDTNQYKQLRFGGAWFWFCDDLDIKWIPYKREDQLKLNTAWRNNVDELYLMNAKYKIKFKRNSNNMNPCGWQYDCNKANAWRRRVIYGCADSDGMLNGIVCKKQAL